MEISQEKRQKILRRIEKVLGSNFEGSKKDVRVYRDRVNFACPYCGDSSDSHKKRANIYWNNLIYHCYNGGCQKHTNVVQFLKDFGETIGNKEDLIEYLDIINENQKKKSSRETLQPTVFINLKKYSIPLLKIKESLNLIDPRENLRIEKYLKSRLMHRKFHHFLYNPREDQIYIFNFIDEDNVIGWQIRNMNPNREKYISYNVEKINKIVMNRSIELSDEEASKMNTISLYFGISTINFERPFTIFEGPIDSFLLSNSIGICGIDKPTEMFDDISTARYFFDNDVEGRREMERKLKIKKSVFMWNKFIKDFKIKKKIKDFNDLIKYCWENKTDHVKNVNEYFTSNPLDIRSI